MPQSVSFGSSTAEIKRLNHPSLNGELKNTSTYFRRDMDWNALGDTISEFPSGTKIILGACSSGDEAYSLRMLLNQKAPDKNFPILAFDIFKEKVDEAKSGIANIWQSCQTKIKEHVGEEAFKKHFKKIPNSDYKPGDKDIHAGALFEVSKELQDSIKFEVGDAIEVTKQKFTEPIIFFFRNAWPYLKENKQAELANNLKKNLPEKSIAIIGDYDRMKSYTPELLNKKGFEALKNSLLIFKKIS